MTAIELDISLLRVGRGHYRADLFLTVPDSAQQSRFPPVPIQLDHEALGAARRLEQDLYADQLTSAFFTAPMREAFREARSLAGQARVPLRMRLDIPPGAPELHEECWELLKDPQGGYLSTDQNVLLSRRLSTSSWLPVRLRPLGSLRALVVVANPQALARYQGLAPIAVEEYLAAARGLFGQQITELVSGGARPPTLANINAELPNHDVIYLICHGQLREGLPYLFLDSAAGEPVPGQLLVEQVRAQSQRPILSVLGSCDSAGAEVALGPLLVEAGVPAVLAMQGKIQMSTARSFLEKLLTRLREDGDIDRAMAWARRDAWAQGSPDFHLPVLFSSLRGGRLLYQKGLSDSQQAHGYWSFLWDEVQRQDCAAVVGWDLDEQHFSTQRDIARRWAGAFRFPLASPRDEELPNVAQYMESTGQSPHLVLGDTLREDLLRLHPQLNRQLDVSAFHKAVLPPDGPHRRLARLGLPLYISTDPRPLMELALKKEGREPQVAFCDWRTGRPTPGLVGTRERPLVFHLLGRFSDVDSLVLSEDDYLDYLVKVTRDDGLVPDSIRRALVSKTLLFAGFHLGDWGLRSLLRMVENLGGHSRRTAKRHLAIQFEPEDGRVQRPEGVRDFIKDHFDRVKTLLYWGTPQEFLEALDEHRPQVQEEEAGSPNASKRPKANSARRAPKSGKADPK